MKKYLKIILTILLVLFYGCFTGFQNSVHAVISIEDNGGIYSDKDTIFALCQEIARSHNLVLDTTDTVIEKNIGYFGVPYHYYEIFISDSLDGKLLDVKFIHHGIMSSPKYRHDDPEKIFLDSLQNKYSSKIIKLDSKITTLKSL